MPQHRFVITREEKSAFGQTFPLSDIVKPVLQSCLGCSNLGTGPDPFPAMDCASVSVCVFFCKFILNHPS